MRLELADPILHDRIVTGLDPVADILNQILERRVGDAQVDRGSPDEEAAGQHRREIRIRPVKADNVFVWNEYVLDHQIVAGGSPHPHCIPARLHAQARGPALDYRMHQAERFALRRNQVGEDEEAIGGAGIRNEQLAAGYTDATLHLSRQCRARLGGVLRGRANLGRGPRALALLSIVGRLAAARAPDGACHRLFGEAGRLLRRRQFLDHRHAMTPDLERLTGVAASFGQLLHDQNPGQGILVETATHAAETPGNGNAQPTLGFQLLVVLARERVFAIPTLRLRREVLFRERVHRSGQCELFLRERKTRNIGGRQLPIACSIRRCRAC